MQYQVIEARSLLQLQEMVNTELRHDWTVTGGLLCFNTTDITGQVCQIFAQAMVKVGQPKGKR